MKFEIHRIEKNCEIVNEETGARRSSSLGVQSRHRTREAAESAVAKLTAPYRERGTGETCWPLHDWDFEVRPAEA